jgi:hypothetical protein
MLAWRLEQERPRSVIDWVRGVRISQDWRSEEHTKASESDLVVWSCGSGGYIYSDGRRWCWGN